MLNSTAELDANDRIRKAFVYLKDAYVPSYMLTFDENGIETGQYRIVSDLLGSVRMVYDLTTGLPAQQIDYDVWGSITSDTNPDFQPFGFAGGLYDQTTKLTRFGARDYDPETGRWTAKDPIGFKGGVNLYGYVANDPVNGIDPTGLIKWSGSVFSVSAGFGYIAGSLSIFTLTSECGSDGKQVLARVTGYGGGASVGWPAGLAASGNVTLNDPYLNANANNLVGQFSAFTIGASVGVGYGGSYYRLGDAVSSLGGGSVSPGSLVSQN